MNRSMQLEQQFCAHNYLPLPVVLVKGEGAYVWDDTGKRYLDMMSAYSAVSHGHCHPRLVRALSQQAARLGVVSRAFYSDQLGEFLQRLCELSGFDMALPMNSGAEAVETAIKAARKWAYSIKGVAPGQAEIIACEGNFHGRTIAVLGLSSEAQYREGFGPFPAGMTLIPYGDASALEQAITPSTAAFLVEPIQGEGGILIPPAGYLAECARICKKHGVLLLCDEIQTGMCRTGPLLACSHEGVTPDGVMLGKALGGGLLPVSAFLARREVMEVFHPGDHGSTFGGSPLAAAVGLEALNIMQDDDYGARAVELGDYFLQKLQLLRSPLIHEVRGKGLLIGMEINPTKADARALCMALMDQGVLSKETHHTVIRFAPPLIITRAQIDAALSSIKEILEEPTR